MGGRSRAGLSALPGKGPLLPDGREQISGTPWNLTQEIVDGDLDQLPVSILHEPRQLMGEAIEAQGRAAELLRQWSSWPDARVQQQITIDKIQEILDLLASDQSEDWDEGDWEDWEEDWDDMEFSDSEGGMNASMEGQGDLAAGAEMQALPVPNYSVEDILMEEQGSLQFRQQQRAAANEGKVEKDW